MFMKHLKRDEPLAGMGRTSCDQDYPASHQQPHQDSACNTLMGMDNGHPSKGIKEKKVDPLVMFKTKKMCEMRK